MINIYLSIIYKTTRTGSFFILCEYYLTGWEFPLRFLGTLQSKKTIESTPYSAVSCNLL